MKLKTNFKSYKTVYSELLNDQSLGQSSWLVDKNVLYQYIFIKMYSVSLLSKHPLTIFSIASRQVNGCKKEYYKKLHNNSYKLYYNSNAEIIQERISERAIYIRTVCGVVHSTTDCYSIFFVRANNNNIIVVIVSSIIY